MHPFLQPFQFDIHYHVSTCSEWSTERECVESETSGGGGGSGTAADG